MKTGLKSFRDEPIEFLLVSKVLQRHIRDFKIADYGWLRRLDVSSVEWVDYR